jgi:hypothetical protein
MKILDLHEMYIQVFHKKLHENVKGYCVLDINNSKGGLKEIKKVISPRMKHKKDK